MELEVPKHRREPHRDDMDIAIHRKAEREPPIVRRHESCRLNFPLGGSNEYVESRFVGNRDSRSIPVGYLARAVLLDCP